MKASVILMAVNFLGLVSSHKRKYYSKCRCMDKEHHGKAAGVAHDDATAKACDIYSTTTHSGVGWWVYDGAGWCVKAPPPGQMVLSGANIDGDVWWDTCRGPEVGLGMQSGQCDMEGVSDKLNNYCE